MQQLGEQVDQINMEKAAMLRKMKSLEKRAQDSQGQLTTAQSDADHFKDQVTL
jgi:hypothetical protein